MSNIEYNQPDIDNLDEQPEDDGNQPVPPKEEKPRKEKKIRTGPSVFSRIFGCLGILVVTAMLLGFLYGLRYSTNFLAPEENSREVVVAIPEGASTQQIANILEQNKIIKSADAFVLAVRVKNKVTRKSVSLKAGEMSLDPSLSVWKTIERLSKGVYKLYPFTVPEGRNIYEIAQMIEAAGLGSKTDFLALCQDKIFIAQLGLDGDSLEGYLFPDTYSFPKGTSLKSIIQRMSGNFLNVWKNYNDLAAEKGLTRRETITLASIVEKETGAPHERGIIAGVFLNRLSKGMRLDTDPTVIYGLLPDNYSGAITRSDLKNPHPYNTYIITGLPPGPITNPGEAAIAAVVKPEIVPYLFFVSKNDGTHHFSETLAEHNRMVMKYQRAPKKGTD